MPKFACSCGNVINLSGDVNNEFILISERVIEVVAEKIEARSLNSVEEFYNDIDRGKVVVYRCPCCGRIYLQNSDNVFDAYVKE